MPAKKIAAAMLMALSQSACAHDWPPEAHGGMAERDRAYDVEIQNALDRTICLQAMPGQHSPAKLAVAQESLIRAQRESAGGLISDADASYLDAVGALGGDPDSRVAPQERKRQLCEAGK